MRRIKRSLSLLGLTAVLGLSTTPVFAQGSSDPQYTVMLTAVASVDTPEVVAAQIAAASGGTVESVVDGTVTMRLPASRVRLVAADPRVQTLTPQADGGAARIAGNAETMTWSTGVAYDYDGAGNVRQIGADAFVYDTVGRLVQSHTNGVPRNYEYDAFGNRTKCRQSEGSSEEGDCQWGYTVSPATNRLNNVGYDAAGNVTAIGAHTYAYDALNMQTRDTWGSLAREYIYTADDERIAVYEVGQRWRWTVRDTSGKVLREFTSMNGSNGSLGTANWQWTKDYVWRGGLLLASRQMEGSAVTTYHYHLDHLGTPRRITDDADRIVGIHDYFPFGTEKGGGQNEPALSLLKFTGHERDIVGTESWDTLDYMHARFGNPTLGRFLSVDDLLTKSALRKPQFWNRYTYVSNNPLTLIDPDGHLLQLTGCAGENRSSPACGEQYRLLLSTFGSKAREAAKHLTLGANGFVTFNGISGAGFAAKFGLMGRAMNYLVSNRAATFAMTVGRNEMTETHNGGYADVYRGPVGGGPGGAFGIDAGYFPATKGFFGITQTETGALVHEIGHAVASVIPGFAAQLQDRKGRNAGMRVGGTYEGYATAFENAWRYEVLGATYKDIRNGYYTAYDIYSDTYASEMFP